MKNTMTLEQQIEYLIICIANTEGLPNYHAIAADAGINTPSNAQRKFKTILERGGRFRLERNVIVDTMATTTNVAPTPAIPKKAGKDKAKEKKKVTKTKKRKLDEVDDDEDDDAGMGMGDTKKGDDGEDESGAGGVGVEVVA